MPVILTNPGAPMYRPGVGLVISSGESEVYAGRNVAAYLGRARMGPINTAIRCTSLAQIDRIFGGAPYGGGNDNTMDGAMEVLRGGAVAVWVVRFGEDDGMASQIIIGSIIVQAKGAGADGDKLSVAMTGAPGAPSRQLVTYKRDSVDAPLEDSQEVDSITFPGNADPVIERDNLMYAFGQLSSDFITLVVDEDVPDAAMPETPETPLAGGKNPSYTMDALDKGLDALASAPWEVLACDYCEQVEVDMTRLKVQDWLMGGKLIIYTVATAPGKAWGAKTSQAYGYNDPCSVLVSNGFTSTGTAYGGKTITGYMSAAREAGRHAALPLGRQLTHSVIRDAVATVDEPAPDIVQEADAAGAYLYTTNERGAVWTEWGLTTYSNDGRPPVWAMSADLGWRKSRLVLTRFRLLTDISLALSPLIETATNNNAGRASVMAQAQAVIDDQYIPTGAVTSGTVIQHPDYPPAGERFTMLISPLITPDGTEQLVVEARFKR